eukprot:m.30691 g.30691  ORF g.30691 m.30691 type:complete len:648 (+) comp12321_c0_seq1:96-2039(+)
MAELGDTPDSVEIDIDSVMQRPAYDPIAELSRIKNAHRESVVSRTAVHEVCLEFRHLSFSIGEQKILHDVSGFAQPGQVLAIMGASGAGKTTLMNLLAGRLTNAKNGETSGEILINGKKRDYSTLRNYTAYVVQEDLFFAELTPREIVTFAAALRLPQNLHQAEIDQRVDDVMAELSLQACQHTRVGNAFVRGLSGGEKKRLNIATQLVTNPSLVLVDEPTTGLDSFNAQNVVATLKSLAQNGRTIIATIHQPRSSLFYLLDNLLLLSCSRTMYFGPTDKCLEYFSRLGYDCPSTFNPFDYIVDLVSVDLRKPEDEKSSRERVRFLTSAYEDYEQQQPPQPECNVQQLDTNTLHQMAPPKFMASWSKQFWLLSQRSLRKVWRDSRSNRAIFAQSVIVSVMLGLIWLRAGQFSSGEEVQAVTGALFFILVNACFRAVFGIIFVFPAEKAVVMKERQDRIYRTSCYYFAKSLAELPRTLLSIFILTLIFYLLVDLRPGVQNYLALYGIVLLVTMAAEGVAYSVSAFARDSQHAGAITPLFIIIPILFGGFFINLDLVPVFLHWLSYVSFVRYGFQLIMQQQFQDRSLELECSSSDLFCPRSGNALLEFYSLNGQEWWENLLILLAFVLFNRLVGFLILLRKGPKFDRTL